LNNNIMIITVIDRDKIEVPIDTWLNGLDSAGDAVIGRDKIVNPGKQNSSSSMECLTESQDPFKN
jgi:hypothetical protein